jgi:hypothetical protein
MMDSKNLHESKFPASVSHNNLVRLELNKTSLETTFFNRALPVLKESFSYRTPFSLNLVFSEVGTE